MNNDYSPREFMKQRRPEKFSDSAWVLEGKLNSSMLEYKLDTITNRNQERNFETFSVKLAQYEICPNLRVQTGPVGGGDSKTDSETYPVSDEIALNWWEGITYKNDERWAFAISAKKDWVSKVKSDVRNILTTEREYKRIYFITSRFAPDKKRAQIEDSFYKASGISVTILDRSWIIDKVFTNNRQSLAIKELNLGEGLEEKTEVGPLDFERSQKFDSLNKSIEESISRGNYGIDIIKKSLKAALVAKELEKPKSQVEGLFDRAIKIASIYGNLEQVFDAKYQKAYTCYFWLEDFPTFIKLYDELEDISKDTANIYTAERQNTLYSLLAILHQKQPSYNISKDEKLKSVVGLLNRFLKDETRPNAALQAESMLILTRLMEAPDNLENVNECFTSLIHVLAKTERMIGFPYEATVTIIQELGDGFGDNREYENLMNRLIEIDIKRKGELPASLALFNYGIQHLNGNRVYKSIDYIGRSLKGLYKEESKKSFIHALNIISIAYERAGLLWASRGALINAASYATSDFWIYNDINPFQAECYSSLKNIELRLGRIGYVLEWHQLDMVISHALNRTEEDLIKLQKDIDHFGHLVGLVIIKTAKEKLISLQQLPDVFMSLGLEFASYALLYLLNGAKSLPNEFLKIGTEEQINHFFSKWLDQPAQEKLAKEPLYYDLPNVTLTSKILGTDFVVTVANSSPGIEIAETLIASIESFLSTLVTHHAVSRIQRLEIKILENLQSTECIRFDKEIQSNDKLIIEHSQFSPHHLKTGQHQTIGDVMLEIISYIFDNSIVVANTEDLLKKLIQDEQVVDRSLSFLSSMVTLGNVLGYQPKRSINDWLSEGMKIYKYEPDGKRVLKAEGIRKEEDLQANSLDRSFLSHTDMETLSIIDEDLWKKARWGGLLFATDTRASPKVPPMLALMFWDGDAAQKIFIKWRSHYGDDLSTYISLTILKGVNKLEPFWYTLVISPKLKTSEMKSNKQYTIVSRCTTMEAQNPNNLNNFLEAYKNFRSFILIPAKGGETIKTPELYEGFPFYLEDIKVKFAWEVGVNDFERTGISSEYEPFIPNEVKNAPILQILKERANNDR